jgi:hypothetical protein
VRLLDARVYRRKAKVCRKLEIGAEGVDTSKLVSTWAILWPHFASALLLALVFFSIMWLLLSPWFRDFGKRK